MYLFVLNAIPITLDGVANDAYDIKSLGKNPEHKMEFWLSLDVNAKTNSGMLLSEVGIDFDAMDDDELLKEIDGIAIQIKLNMKVVGKVAYGVVSSLVLGLGMAMVMVFEGMILLGMVVGIVGIIMLLFFYN